MFWLTYLCDSSTTGWNGCYYFGRYIARYVGFLRPSKKQKCGLLSKFAGFANRNVTVMIELNKNKLVFNTVENLVEEVHATPNRKISS